MSTKKRSELYAPQCLLKWYFSKIACERGAIKKLAEYCQCSQAFLGAVMSLRAPMPIMMAIKISIYSNGDLYIGDVCPTLKKYIPLLVNQYERKFYAKRFKTDKRD